MGSVTSESQPSYGKRLLPNLIDEIAKWNPGRAFASVSKSTNIEDGFEEVSYLAFAKAIDRCSWWMEEVIGKGQKFETIGYLGPLDLRYPIFILAAIKTGHKAFLSSPRNSLNAHLDLLESTQCETFFIPDAAPLVVEKIVSKRQMTTIPMPELDFFLGPRAEDVPTYPYLKSFDEARYDPFVVLHTSGSTGFPKAVVMNHGTLTAMDAYQMIPALGGKPTYGNFWRGTKMFLGFPLYHAASICCLLGMGVYCDIHCVLPPPVPLTAEVAHLVHIFGNVQGSALPPSILVDLSAESEKLDTLQNLQHVTYGGGPMPSEVGDLVASKTRLMAFFGSTETGLFPIELGDSVNWDSLKYSPFLGHEFRPHPDLDGLCELVIVKNQDLELFQGIFSTFPDIKEYPTKDLYSKISQQANCWTYCGRSDDIIAFSNGEKLNPIDMEKIVASHPAVISALVGGHGRFQSCLLIEPRLGPESHLDRENLLEEIWPTVQRANQDCPAHGCVMKDFILFTDPQKPMLRNPKNTVQRSMTMELYKNEIQALYTSAAFHNTTGALPFCPSKSEPLRESLHRLVASSTSLKHITDTADFFRHGLDSLQVINLATSVNAFLAVSYPKMSPISSKIVYAHPTIQKLESALQKLATDETHPIIEDRCHQMDRTLAEHSEGLLVPGSCEPGSVVLLTGSTGSLGSYLLDSLVRDPEIRKVYCLNRDANAQSRQRRSHFNKGLSARFEKVDFLQCDVSREHLGLDDPTYTSLLLNVTHVVHNAWETNFNWTLDSYSHTHLHGVRHLLNLTYQSAKTACMMFISTYSTVQRYNEHEKGEVPEIVFDNWSFCQETGYAESKSVAERLIDAANQKGARGFICRVGQIAGPTSEHGIWPKQEWLPSAIASSLYLGKIPCSLGAMDRVDWIPVDVLSQILVELMKASDSDNASPREASHADICQPSHNTFQREPQRRSAMNPCQTKVYHVTNPRTTMWSEICQCILSAAPHLNTVTLSEWVSLLSESISTTEDIAKNPALKLLSYFENMAKRASSGAPSTILSTFNSVHDSTTMAKLTPIDRQLMQNWMKQWGF